MMHQIVLVSVCVRSCVCVYCGWLVLTPGIFVDSVWVALRCHEKTAEVDRPVQLKYSATPQALIQTYDQSIQTHT